MENFMSDKKNVIIAALSIILLVIVVCGICRMSSGRERFERNGMHRMPNGQMMMNKSGEMMNSGGSMSSMMMNMNKALEGKTGDAFDQAFLSEMIVHHQGAVEMANLVLKTSKRPELIKLANDIIAAQNGEIKMMQDWNKTWFSK